MFGGQSERPDALLILDDNLVEHATAGLIAAGVRVPEDLDVVAHCNFPWPTPSVLPLTRIGFNNTEVVRHCVDLIDAMCAGQTVPAITEIAAVREDEVTT
jgi:DNA-binding LacI/PurR family transcriptional regulator